MTRSDSSKSNHKSSNIIKKIGITFIIPIFLAICGALIVLSSGWKYISTGLTYGNLIFQKPEINENALQRRVYRINGKDVYRPFLRDAFATIKIPSINLDKTIYEGDDDETLAMGIGHYQGSLLPGERGNFVISGHRDTDFMPLQDIKMGDEVIVETSYGKYHYKVSSIDIVKPEDVSLVAPTKYEKLTMYTCYPFSFIGNAPERYVVSCEYVSVEG